MGEKETVAVIVLVVAMVAAIYLVIVWGRRKTALRPDERDDVGTGDDTEA